MRKLLSVSMGVILSLFLMVSIAGAASSLVMDFGTNGLWVHDGSSWTQITTVNPSNMEAWENGLAVDLNPYGLWNYQNDAWDPQLTSLTSESMEAWSAGLAVDFGASYGLFNHTGTGWNLLTSINPVRMVSWIRGLAVDITPYGLWNHNGTFWDSQLTGLGTENMISWTGGLAVDFGTYGLFINNGTSWTLLSTFNPESIAAWAANIAVDFGASGLWSYNGQGWVNLSGLNPNKMTAWAGGLAVDFGANGLYSYNGSAWTKLSDWSPEGMTQWGSSLVLDFGANGVWVFNGTNLTRLLNWNPDKMAEGFKTVGPNLIPDTGQTTSYTDTFGEDSDYTINPQSYTKLDANGNDLPDSATTWVMVRDNVTGLIWEIKTDDGGIHDKDNIYYWQDAQDVFIAQLNSDNFGGYSDWRMPTIKELATLRLADQFNPTVNGSYFTNTMSSYYWSSTTYASSTSMAWDIDFSGGDVYGHSKARDEHVRAVRGGQSGKFDDSITPGRMLDNGDGTVIDTETGLMWQQGETMGMSWDTAIIYCETLQLAGYQDWRLPNINELQSIVDHNVYGPAISTTAFPGAMSSAYWSSTTRVYYTDCARFVRFTGGSDSYGYKSNNYYVRSVRGGTIQDAAPPTASITSPASAVTIEAGNSVSFQGSVSGGVKPFSYAWDFDGGSTNVTVEDPDDVTFNTPGTYSVTFTVTDADGDSDISDPVIVTVNASVVITGGIIPDTGQTTSYTDTFGEDSDYTINPQSYTKLDANGNDLPDSATTWVMVRDNVTGLIWEIKTDDGGIHDKDNTYNWQNAQDLFITQINNSNFGGNSDWRMPTIKELATLRNADQINPAINGSYFQNTMSSPYWSSTTDAYDTDDAWYVAFYGGGVYYYDKTTNNFYVRAVRGGQSSAFDDSIIPERILDNGDGTVTDTETGLMWQQREAGAMAWNEALIYCESLALAGYHDWRLPNINELQSIVDYQAYNPAANNVAFPATMSSYYWSSTTGTYFMYHAWCVGFINGYVDYGNESTNYYVRAVRNGQ